MTTAAQNSKQILAPKGTAGTPSHSFLGGNATGMYLAGTNQLGFSTAGTFAALIDSSGNVGIGTTSPGVKLDVRTAAGTAVTQYLYTGSSAAAATLQFGQVGAVGWNTGITASSGNFQIGIDGGGLGYNINRTGVAIDYHSWLTAGSERMRIDSSGNVGIGTSSAYDLLSLSSTSGAKLRISSTTSTANAQQIYNPVYNETRASDTSYGSGGTLFVGVSENGITGSTSNMWSSSSGYVGAAFMAFSGYSTATTYVGDIRFFTKFANVTSERMRIDSSGNVGIGSLSPTAAKLVVVGPTAAAGATSIVGNFNSSAADTSTYYNGTKLALQNANSTSGTMSYLGFVSANGNDYAGVVGTCTTHTFGAAVGYLGFYTNNGSGAATERMRIDSSGNVGIGTASPTRRLSVVNTASGSPLIEITGNAGAGYELGFGTDTNGGFISQSGATNLQFFVNGSERMRIDSSGNVGIGTSSPSAKLVVSGYSSANSDSELQLYRSSSGTGIGTGPGIRFNDGTTNNTRIIQNGSGALQFWHYSGSWQQEMTLDSSGNLGVGTSSPTTKLTIQSSGANGLSLYQNGADAARLFFVNNTPSQGCAINNAGGSLAFYVGGSIPDSSTGTERARIDSSGNLLVGTTTTGGRLRVKSANTDSSTYGLFVTDSSDTLIIGTRNDGYVRSPAIYSATSGSAANVFVDSGGYMYRSTSSLKYKRDVADATHGLAEVMQLRPVTYKGKSENDGDTVFGGLIAEEVHAAGLTEFVQYADDGSPDALAYGNMVSLLVKAIQELSAKNDALEARLAKLENV